MKFSYNWLKSMVEFKESPQKLAELLNQRSFEVESVEKVGKDFALDAKIPANRISDAASHLGLANEIGAILKLKVKSQKSKVQVKIQNDKAAPPIQIKIIKPELCPRYSAQVLEVKNLGVSPKWMQERLITCGLRPMNAVVDITNYVMLETGQPLHAFDLDKIIGGKMTIREAAKGEGLTTLDGTKHILPRGAIVIEDAKRIIDLAGIMGGENSAVEAKTRRILLQAASFEPVKIYKTSRALNFSSAASKIYSAGIDPNQTLIGLGRAVELFEKMLKAKKSGALIDIYPEKVAPAHILFRTDYANRLIGQELAPIFHKTIFERLGFTPLFENTLRSWRSVIPGATLPRRVMPRGQRAGFTVEKEGRDFVVKVPTIRRDIKLEEDLIEETARLFGYEKLPGRLPEITISPPVRNDEIRWEERIRDQLAGAGFTESKLYAFVGDRELDDFYLEKKEALELENPMSPETKYLVPRALIKYVASAAGNLRNFDAVRIFGIGKSFQKNQKGINEHKDLILVLAEKGAGGEEEFYQLKGVVDEILENMRIGEHWYDDYQNPKSKIQNPNFFHPYRMAEIKIENEKIGNIGEIHPEVCKNIKAKARITAAEIDFGKLWRLAAAEAKYRPVGKYPAVIRDIAVIVPFNLKTEEALNVIENIGGKLLVDTDLFDYFQDEQMREAEEKSLAFHLVFQSPERTLKDEEVTKIVEKIMKVLEEKGWEVRK